MGWRGNRRRSICKKIMFAPEEWEQARKIHERWARNIPVYRRWGDFARQTLMHGALMNVSARRIRSTYSACGYVMVVFTTMRGWLTEGTLGVHIVLWTLAAMVGFVLAGHLAMIPHNPMGWPTWWILLTVAAHLIYLAKLADPISRFIRNGQDMGM